MTTPEMKKLASNYHRAVNGLDDAEARHNESIERFDDAKAQRLPEKVTQARVAVVESEKHLEDALHAAFVAHREYWTARRMALLPELHRAAELVHRYNHIAFAAGVTTHSPGIALIQNALTTAGSPEVIDDVPVEGPDSELLANWRGYWK